MTQNQVQNEVKNLRKIRKKVKDSPEKARELLVKTGMYTPTGQLKKQFR